MNDITPDQLNQLCNAHNRLIELRSKKSPIISKESQSAAEEIKTLEQYVGSFLLQHSGQFISSYLTIKREYEPLIMILAPRFTQHTLGVIQQVGKVQAQKDNPPAENENGPEPAAENVVPLNS